jgi:6-phosphogluconolactonase/glucosamine-6-phosphate isomerase/deaminase
MSSSIVDVLSQRLHELVGKLPSTQNNGSSHPTILVLLAGGSLVQSYSEILAKLDSLAEKHGLEITISLTDERIAANNTWQDLEKFDQELNAGGKIRLVRPASPELDDAWRDTDLKVGLFGAGNDLHTAGILPFEREIFASIFPVGIDFTKYDVPTSHPNQTTSKRWTISPIGISKLDLALLVLGEGKQSVANFVEKNSRLSNVDIIDRQHEFPLLALRTAKNFELVQTS